MTRTAALLCAAVLALTGCSASSQPSRDSAAPVVPPSKVTEDHNDADLAYVDRMLSQHQQVVDLVAMVPNKDVPPELARLARRLGDARTEEMGALRKMAEAWGVPKHAPDYHANPGELTIEQLVRIYELEGADFSERWTQQVIDNQRGAVALSRAELDNGLNLGAREFARGLVRLLESQTAKLEALQG